MGKKIGKVGGSVDHFEDLAGGSKYHCRELNHAFSLAEQATQAQANQAETHDFLSTTQGQGTSGPGHTGGGRVQHAGDACGRHRYYTVDRTEHCECTHMVRLLRRDLITFVGNNHQYPNPSANARDGWTGPIMTVIEQRPQRRRFESSGIEGVGVRRDRGE